MPARALNLWVFRESRRLVDGRQLRSALLNSIDRLRGPCSKNDLIAALLRAGELESAIADVSDDGSVPVERSMLLTERIAEAMLSQGPKIDLEELRRTVEDSQVPHQLRLSPAEGFAYYALHPLSYADVLKKIPELENRVAVVGIRSIGTTLSAVVSAAARCANKSAERITVRPEGHPYNRCIRLSPSQLDFVHRQNRMNACFLIVDEGPGLSGSSFLSVAEALEASSVPRERITLLCAHEPCFRDLRADNAPQRARRFRWKAVSSGASSPDGTCAYLGGGEWRKHVYTGEDQWPASWVSFERLKYLSHGRDETRLFKFAGLGHYGDPVLDRENRVADAGYGPSVECESDGFASYPWISGRRMHAGDLSENTLRRLAAYCAFRAREFAVDLADLDTLQRMAEHNLQQSGIALTFRLCLERPAIVDGRMQPHEWALVNDQSRRMRKTDSGSHGDDHFFPGPTDIAWDLAGAIVEWRMTRPQSAFFLEEYARASRDDAAGRIGSYIIAYAAFRTAYCRMAANALHGSEEETRLERAAEAYESNLRQLQVKGGQEAARVDLGA